MLSMKILAIILLLTCAAYSQLSDAPQVQTCQNNRPYTTGKLAKLVGSCPFDKPQAEKWDGRTDRFIHFGNGRRVLHPSKKSWIIIGASHSALWGVTVFAVRRHVTSLEDASSEYPAVGFVTGIDLLLFMTVSPVSSIGYPIYGFQHYLRAGLR